MDNPLHDHPQFKAFLAYLRLKNISRSTIDRYTRTLAGLFKEVGSSEGNPAQITTTHLRSYVLGLQQRGLSPNTVAGHVLAIRQFFGFLLEEGHITADPSRGLPSPKVGQRLPKVLSTLELQQLFATFDETTCAGRRDKFFFLLSYAAGLRISEATHLRVEDIDWGEGALRVVGKGDKERRIYLKPLVLELLREYLHEPAITDYLFPSRNGAPVSASCMDAHFRQSVKASRISRPATPHSLRHSIAVHYLVGGAPLSFVQHFLGHASLATTGIYTRLTDPMTKEIALRIPTATEAAEKKRKECTRVKGGAESAQSAEQKIGLAETVLGSS
jgi:integrase/recombinase XerD